MLKLFHSGADIYCAMASDIYGYPCTKAHVDERALGKVAILGLGYQMGAEKFQATCLKMAGITIDEDLAKQVVDTYREKRWRVKQLWRTQEHAACNAVKTGQPMQGGHVSWFMDDGFLRCVLPSGRWLSYPNPMVIQDYTPWGELRDILTYEGINAYTRQWCRQKSYGGMLVENITQAVSRDILAEAMLRCESSGIYLPVLSVHDEILAESPLGVGTVSAFEQLMAECPAWASGCPIRAEGWSGFRYRK